MTDPGSVNRYREVAGDKLEVEAIQLVPGTDNWKDACDWMQASDPRPKFAHVGNGVIHIYSDSVTPRTVHVVNPGSWIVRFFAGGEFFWCAGATFKKLFEPFSPSPVRRPYELVATSATRPTADLIADLRVCAIDVFHPTGSRRAQRIADALLEAADRLAELEERVGAPFADRMLAALADLAQQN